MPLPPHPKPTDPARLAMCRAKLAALGPSCKDMTGAQIARRRELEARIADLESAVAEQLALAVDEPTPTFPVETDAGVEDVPLALFGEV